MKLEIALIRHGQIRPGPAKLIGVTNEPLGKDGAELIRNKSAAGEYPKVQFVYTSELLRCFETAEIVGGDQNVLLAVTKDLGPPDYGDFDGRELSELAGDKRFAEWSNSVGVVACPNGEEPFRLLARSASAFSKIAEEMACKGLERVAVVTHRMVIQSILNRYCVPRSNYADREIPPGGGHLIRYDTVNMEMRILNKF